MCAHRFAPLTRHAQCAVSIVRPNKWLVIFFLFFWGECVRDGILNVGTLSQCCSRRGRYRTMRPWVRHRWSLTSKTRRDDTPVGLARHPVPSFSLSATHNQYDKQSKTESEREGERSTKKRQASSERTNTELEYDVKLFYCSNISMWARLMPWMESTQWEASCYLCDMSVLPARICGTDTHQN